MLKLLGTIFTQSRERREAEAIKSVFEDRYKGYLFPFERAKEKLMEMPVAQKVEYFRAAKDILENRVYQSEIQELIRTYYQQLAVKSSGSDEATAYRLTLMALQDFDKRLRELAVQYLPPSANEISKNL